jgi:hypothetical protein
MRIGDKICFIIAPIGEPGSSVRDRSDKVLKFIIEPVANKCGYKALRADKLPQPGLITTQIIQHLLNDPIVIADLSDHNPNVYYELAIRHVIKKPYIHLIESGQKIPFDILATRTIYYNHKDLEIVEKTKKELENQIRFAEQNPNKIDSPISYSFDLSMLSESPNPVDKDIVSIIGLIQNLQLEISHFTSNIQTELREIKQHIYPQQVGVVHQTKIRDVSRLDKIQQELGVKQKGETLPKEDEDV